MSISSARTYAKFKPMIRDQFSKLPAQHLGIGLGQMQDVLGQRRGPERIGHVVLLEELLEIRLPDVPYERSSGLHDAAREALVGCCHEQSLGG